MNDLGVYLSNCLKENNISVNQCSIDLGVSSTMISLILHNKKKMPYDLLINFMKHYGFSYDLLLLWVKSNDKLDLNLLDFNISERFKLNYANELYWSFRKFF